MELSKVKKLKEVVNQLHTAIKQQHKLLDTDTSSMTRTKIYSLRNRKETNGTHIENLYHDIHCLGVKLGFAKKEEWRYEKK